jgi:septal ring factor EnvC (AmiA/AmiB activator)
MCITNQTRMSFIWRSTGILLEDENEAEEENIAGAHLLLEEDKGSLEALQGTSTTASISPNSNDSNTSIRSELRALTRSITQLNSLLNKLDEHTNKADTRMEKLDHHLVRSEKVLLSVFISLICSWH